MLSGGSHLAGLCPVELCAARSSDRAAFAADEDCPINRLLGQVEPFMLRSNAAPLTLPMFHSTPGFTNNPPLYDSRFKSRRGPAGSPLGTGGAA